MPTSTRQYAPILWKSNANSLVPNGAMWASPPTNLPEGFQKSRGDPGRVSEIPWRPRKVSEIPWTSRKVSEILWEPKSSEAIDFFRHSGIIKAEKFIRCIMTCALGCVRDEGIRCKSGAWKRSRHCMRLPREEKSGHWGNPRRLRGGRGRNPGSISRQTYDDGKAARSGGGVCAKDGRGRFCRARFPCRGEHGIWEEDK